MQLIYFQMSYRKLPSHGAKKHKPLGCGMTLKKQIRRVSPKLMTDDPINNCI